jgi:hypothetical protein
MILNIIRCRLLEKVLNDPDFEIFNFSINIKTKTQTKNRPPGKYLKNYSIRYKVNYNKRDTEPANSRFQRSVDEWVQLGQDKLTVMLEVKAIVELLICIRPEIMWTRSKSSNEYNEAYYPEYLDTYYENPYLFRINNECI